MTPGDAVARGLALLDDQDPGWAKDVDPALLDIADCDLCVLGQRHGTYDHGLAALGITDDDAPAYGFDTAPGGSSADLTDQWRDALRQRATAGGEPS